MMKDVPCRFSSDDVGFDEIKIPKGVGDIFKEYLDEYFRAHDNMEPSSGLYTRILSEIEPQIFESTLAYTNGNRVKAAEILGINRNTLRKKMQIYNISILDDE